MTTSAHECSQLFSDPSALSVFKRAIPISNVFSQCFVDQRLVIATTGLMHLIAKPIQDIGIYADGDVRFAGKRLYNRSTFSIARITFFFTHQLFFRFGTKASEMA